MYSSFFGMFFYLIIDLCLFFVILFIGFIIFFILVYIFIVFFVCVRSVSFRRVSFSFNS